MEGVKNCWWCWESARMALGFQTSRVWERKEDEWLLLSRCCSAWARA